MPLIAIAAGYFAGAALAGAAVTAGLVVAGGIGAGLIALGTSMVVSNIVGSLFAENAPTPQATANQQNFERGILLNTSSTVEPIPVVYGTRRIGGTRVFMEETGATNEYLHVVIAHCEGEIQSISSIYLNDVLWSDAKFTGLVTLSTHMGADAQIADAALTAAVPKWDATHKLSGVAYSYLRLKYDSTNLGSLPTITADILGRKVYDPRTGLIAWSNNPALCLRDYLTNTRFGRGIPAAAIDDAAIIAAANYCDQSVSIPGGSQARYTCDGVIDTSANSMDNVRALLTSCRGMLVFTNGKYKLVIDKPETAAFTFNEDNICGAWTIKSGDKSTRYNRIRASFTNPLRSWQPDLAVIDSTAMRTADNGLLLESQINLPFTANLYRASQITQIELKNSRFGVVAQFTAFIEGLRAEVGDVVNITHSTPGWIAKPFRVTRMVLLSSDEVEVTISEYDASVYNLDVLDTARTSVATALPDAFSSPAPTGLTLSSGQTEVILLGDGTMVPRLKVAWTASASAFITMYEIQWKRSADSLWNSQTTTNVSAFWITPVVEGTAYDVRIRAFNAIGIASTWATQLAYAALGYNLVPPDITGLTIEPGGGTAFTGRGVTVRWDSKPYALSYRAEVWAGGTLLLKRTVNDITDPRYTYTFENAVADGGPWRALTFKIYAINATGPSATPAVLAVTNATPPAPAGLSVTAGTTSVTVAYTHTTDTDFSGTMIWGSTTLGFTPGAGNLLYDGPDVAVTLPGLTGGIPYYVRVAQYDVFGKTFAELTLSGEVSATPWAAGGGVEVVNTLPTTGLTDGRVVYLTTDQKIYRYTTTAPAGWKTWVDGTDILASSITAGKLAVTDLSAISGNLGTITSNEIHINGVNGRITGGAFSNWAWPTSGQGFYLGSSGLLMGNVNTGPSYFEYESATGNFYTSAFDVIGGAVTIKGSLSAGSINAVNTINIAGNAVTIPINAYSYGPVYVPSGGSAIVQSAYIVSTGAPILILFSSSTNDQWAKCGVWIYRDGTLIYATATGYVNSTQVSGGISDTPGAGGHTYYFYLYCPAGLSAFNSYYNSLSLLETKR